MQRESAFYQIDSSCRTSHGQDESDPAGRLEPNSYIGHVTANKSHHWKSGTNKLTKGTKGTKLERADEDERVNKRSCDGMNKKK